MRSEAPMAAKRRLGVVCNSVLFATRCCVRRVDAERSSDGSEATARFCVRLGVVCDGWTRSEAPLAAKRRLDVVCDSVLFVRGRCGAKLRWQQSDGSVLCATRCCVRRRVDAERSSDGSEATARCCVRLVVVCNG